MDPVDQDPPAAPPTSGPAGLSRRKILTGAAGVAGLATVTWFWFEEFGDPSRRAGVIPTAEGAPARSFTAAQARTLAAGLDRLLPSAPDSPGARDVNAFGYLDAVMQEDWLDDYTRRLLAFAPRGLESGAQNIHRRSFADLPPAQQDDVIQRIADYRNAEGTYEHQGWLGRLLSFTLEAFFGDPVHGGNPGGVAWKWAGHQPALPRPTEPDWRPRERL